MPKFEKPDEDDNFGLVPRPKGGVPDITSDRCHCCQHNHRRVIDRLIATGASYAEIGRLFSVSDDSVRNHALKHLRYEERAIRDIVESEAKAAEENAEEGIGRATQRRVFLETYLFKTREALLNGELELSGKDAMAAIQMLDQQDRRAEGAGLDVIQAQFLAFQQAIRELTSPEVWHKIMVRAREIYEVEGAPQIEE